MVSDDDGRTWHRRSGTSRSPPSTTSRSRAATWWRRPTAARSGSWTTSRPCGSPRRTGPRPASHLFPPRPTVRPWQNWSVDLFRGPGKAHKNYMMALGTGLTFYEDRTPDGRARPDVPRRRREPAGRRHRLLQPERGVRAGPVSPDVPRRPGGRHPDVHDAAGERRPPLRRRRPAAHGPGRATAPHRARRPGRALPHRPARAQPLRVGSPLSRRREGPGRRPTEKAITGPLAPPGTLPGPPDGGRPLVDPVLRDQEGPSGHGHPGRPRRAVRPLVAGSGTRCPPPTRASTGSGGSAAR